MAIFFNSFTSSLSADTNSTMRPMSPLIHFIAACSEGRKCSKGAILHKANIYDFPAGVFLMGQLATLAMHKTRNQLHFHSHKHIFLNFFSQNMSTRIMSSNQGRQQVSCLLMYIHNENTGSLKIWHNGL